ncbi:glycosyltransferase family 39 protein [Candidatus Micrarchaeota archaeon]|nr:glycosyltransferase family 39 protein [Candidatus Micrarchaeota archaeon]
MDRNLAAAVVIAALAAIAIASYYPLVGDEQFHAYAAMWSAKSGVLASNNLEFFKGWTYIYPPLFHILEIFSLKAFGGILGTLGSARLVSVISYAVLAALSYLFTKRFLPDVDARWALLFATASPFLLSNSGLATITPLGLLFAMAFLYSLLGLLERPTMRNAAIAGGAMGLAMNAHYYFLSLPAVFVAVASVNYLKKKNNFKFKTVGLALVLGIATGAPFYLNNLVTYGYLNGPSGTLQNTPGEGIISAFKPEVVYFDIWLSGLNAFVHRGDLFSTFDAIFHLPIPSFLPWLAVTGALTLVILLGMASTLRTRPELAAAFLVSLPPLYFGDGFWRYSGVDPILSAVFFSAGVTFMIAETKKRMEDANAPKIISAVLLACFAVLLLQTAVTAYYVHGRKQPLHSFVQSIPQKAGGETFCELMPPGSYRAALPSILLDREVEGCGPAWRDEPGKTSEMGRWVFVQADSANYPPEIIDYFHKALAGYEKVDSITVAPVGEELWRRK